MKYDCVQTKVDLDGINVSISCFAKRFGQPRYLVFNATTFIAFKAECLKRLGVSEIADKSDGVAEEYMGIPIAISSSLKYGEVDII